MTPDWSAAPSGVPYASFADPQSLDLYLYTLDNPVSGADPDGHDCGVCDAALDLSREAIDAVVGPLVESAAAGAEAAGGAVLSVGGGAVAIVLTPKQLGSAKEFPTPCGGPVCAPAPTAPKPGRTEVAEHRKGARESTRGRHEKGAARRRRSVDLDHPSRKHRPPRRRPKGTTGPWPKKPDAPPPPPPSAVGPRTGLFSLPSEMVNAMVQSCQHGNAAACL